MSILIDSSLLCGFANRDDSHHHDAWKIMKDIVSGKHGVGIVTDYIFEETVTVISRKLGRSVAIKLARNLIRSEIRLCKIDTLVLNKSWKLFKDTQELSFTDCTCVVYMDITGIEKIATFDHDFKSLKGVEIIGS